MDVVTHDLLVSGSNTVRSLMLRYRVWWWSRGKELVLRGHSIRLVRFRTFGRHVIPGHARPSQDKFHGQVTYVPYRLQRKSELNRVCQETRHKRKCNHTTSHQKQKHGAAILMPSGLWQNQADTNQLPVLTPCFSLIKTRYTAYSCWICQYHSSKYVSCAKMMIWNTIRKGLTTGSYRATCLSCPVPRNVPPGLRQQP
jgi:hypothetical protein